VSDFLGVSRIGAAIARRLAGAGNPAIVDQQAALAAETATEIVAGTGPQCEAVEEAITDRVWLNSYPWEGAS
jgi:NAD(P)-dependent dehydrogenase (short-subunit alcohol dehydrogenase family)